MNGLGDFSSAMSLARIIRERNIHILHCHLGISAFLGIIAARRAGCRRVVVTRHFVRDRYTTVHPVVYPFYLKIYQWMNRQTDVTVCVSEAVKREVVKREGLPAGKCVVIPNGIGLEREVAVSLEEKRVVRNGLGLPYDCKMVVTLSRLVEEKGIDVLIDAAAVGGRDDLFLVVVGSGNQERFLRQKAKSLGLDMHVLFTGYRKDALRILSAADVFVLPAYEEPFGISVLEAMSLGIPVVATDAGGPSEILTDGENGLLVPPNNAKALAEGIMMLIDNPSKAQYLAENAVRRVRGFDERVVVKTVEKIYLDLMDKKR
jgi:glycosyltransferase involved in cell wall biosynthesis